MKYKVILDVFGGDFAPYETIKGAIGAVEENRNLHVILAGDKDLIKQELINQNYTGSSLSLLHAPEVIENDESPAVAIKKKPNSSIAKGLELLRKDDSIDGFVSAGSTGAILAGSVLKVGRIKGINRPALIPTLPTVNGGIVAVADVGANMDSKPLNLLQFALMGSAYLKNVYGIDKPKVGLLSVGEEEGKGNDLTKEAYDLINKNEVINFVGNIEGRDVLSGKVDLVVTDGFSGNVLLKSTEGAVSALMKILKSEIESSFFSKLGYLFMRKSFRNLKKTLDYSQQGGAVFLGCKKLVIKSHGTSKALSIKKSILQVVEMKEAKVIESIEEDLKELV